MRALAIVLLILGSAWWQTYGPASKPKAATTAELHIDHDADYAAFKAELARRQVARSQETESQVVERRPAGFASEWFSMDPSNSTAFSRIIATTEKGSLAFWTIFRHKNLERVRRRYPTLAEVKAANPIFWGNASFSYSGDDLLIGDDAELAPGATDIRSKGGFIDPRLLNVPHWDGLSRLRFERDGGLTVIDFEQDPIDALWLDEDRVPRRYALLMSK